MSRAKTSYTPDQYSQQAKTITWIILMVAGIVLFSVGFWAALAVVLAFFLGIGAGTASLKAQLGRDTLKVPAVKFGHSADSAIFDKKTEWLQ